MMKHILYILLLFCGSTLMAQNNAIFSGGNSDGYDKDNYLQPLFLSVSFLGGNGDGYSKDCYTQTPFLTVAFGGGNNDGYAKDCYTQISNLNNIFSGGNGGGGMMAGCANEPLGCFLTIALGNDTTFCDGQTFTLDAGIFSGGATYLWQDNSASQTFLVDTTGVYYVTVIDSGGCTGTDSIIITVNPQPIVNLGNDTAFCVGGSLVLDAQNSGATFQWQNGVTAPFFNQTFTAATTGQYFVNVAFGICSDSDTINVTVNPIVTTNLTDSIICQGDSSLIFGVYQTVAGIYIDTLISFTGCDSILTQTLVVNPTYAINMNTSICNDDSILLGGNFQTLAGVYNDTLSTINGCDSIISTTLTVNPIFTNNQSQTICDGDSVLLGGVYQFIGGIYFDTLSSVFGCDSTIVTTLTVNPISQDTIASIIICGGDSALIFGSFQSIAGYYQGTFSATTTCDSVVTQQLVVNSLPTINLGTDSVICENDSITLDAGTNITSYVWSTGDTTQTLLIDATTLTTGMHSYYVQGTDTNGCINSDTVLVDISVCTGIYELERISYNLYPNPTKGNITLTSNRKIERIEFYNLIGEKVMDRKVATNNIIFNIEHFNKGIYIVRILYKKETKITKIILD